MEVLTLVREVNVLTGVYCSRRHRKDPAHEDDQSAS